MAREEPVRAQEEKEQTRGTHFLEMAEGRIGQGKEGNQSREGLSLPEDDRGRDLSRHGKFRVLFRERGL